MTELIRKICDFIVYLNGKPGFGPKFAQRTPMEELIARFRENGLTHEQIDRTVSLISRWLEEHYPVAGVVVETWVKNELSLMEEK